VTAVGSTRINAAESGDLEFTLNDDQDPEDLQSILNDTDSESGES